MKSVFKSNKTIKLLGDSITAGAGSSDDCRDGEVIATIDGQVFKRQLGKKCWASLFASYMKKYDSDCRVINNGCSGIDSTQLRRYLPELISVDDAVVLLMIGTNNRKHLDGMNILFQDLMVIINQLKMSNKEVVLMMANPVTTDDDCQANRLFRQADVNEVMKQVAQQTGVTFINYYEYVQNYAKKMGQSIEEVMIGGDGLHPTDTVYELMFKYLIEILGA